MNLQRSAQPFVNVLVMLVMFFNPFGSVQGTAHASPAPAQPAKTILLRP